MGFLFLWSISWSSSIIIIIIILQDPIDVKLNN